MAKTFTFTSPNGKIYDISGPDDATQEQAFAILQSQIGTPGPGSKDFAPSGADKPGLPDSRTMPTPKNFPGFGNPAAEYARRQEPVRQILDGAARMTGSAARRSGGDVADARFGGASDIMRGAAEIAAPLAAVPLAGAGSIGAGAAMLGRMALGAGGGYLGGKLLRAQVPKDKPGLQNFVENVGETAGGLLAGGVSESPKVGAFVKGAAKEVPKKLPSAMLAGAAGHALGRPGTMAILEALYAGPSIIRGGMAEAAGKPWLGPVFSGILGKNKPQPLTAQQAQVVAAKQEYLRLRGLIDEAPPVIPQGPSPTIPAPTELPSGRPVGGIWNQTEPVQYKSPQSKWSDLRKLIAEMRPLMDEAPPIIPQGPSPRITAATELPSGRPVGGIFNQTAPSPTPAPNPQGVAAKQEAIRLQGLPFAPPVRVPPSKLEIPVKTELPSGRPVGGIWNQNKPLTPAEIIAADAKSKAAIEALKARQAAKQNARPAPTPKPAEKSATPSENAAAKMAAQDAAGQERTGLMNDVVAQAEAEAAAAVKDLEWRKRSGTIGEKMTKTKQDALIAFAAEKGKPMTRFTESEYNDLVSEFNAAGKKRATGKPFKMNFAGADYNADGEKYGRDVEMTLRHFNNMRLGKK